MSYDKPLSHAQYLRLVRKQRRADAGVTRDVHGYVSLGLWLFISLATGVCGFLIGFALGQVNP